MKSNTKVAAIHDLSGVGRCSLTVILPTLSAMGDLTDYMSPALEHYKRFDMDFDCIYSGFLASTDQIDHCLEFFADYPKALKVVDPVMADHGKPYKTCTAELRRRMGELVAVADIITPNMTEAAILLGEDPNLLARSGSSSPAHLSAENAAMWAMTVSTTSSGRCPMCR